MKFTFKHKLIALISCYVMVMTACITGLVISNNINSQAETTFNGWSDESRVFQSAFYKRYYDSNHVFQFPPSNVVEVSSPECLGAISYVSHQERVPTDGRPARNSFPGLTIKLMRDISLANYVWTPIANDFKGNVDGNGFSITGMNKFTTITEKRPRFQSWSGAAGNAGLLTLTQNNNYAFISGIGDSVTVNISNLEISGKITTNALTPITNQTIQGMRTTNTTRYSNSQALPLLLQGALTGPDLLVSDQVEGAIPTSHVSNYSPANLTNVRINRGSTVAGFVNDISPSTKLVFSNCVSRVNIEYNKTSTIQDTSNAFGFLSSANAENVNVTDLPNDLTFRDVVNQARVGVFFDACINYGNFTMQNPLLGAAGLAAAATVITNCANNGNITANEGYIGGLVIGSNGRDMYIRYSYNNGTLSLMRKEGSGGGAVGGIAVGHIRPSVEGANIIIRDCANYGFLQSTSSNNTMVGGILAQYHSVPDSGHLYIENCLNKGMMNVSADNEGATNYLSGIVARVGGAGSTHIAVVYTSSVSALGANRGGAIIDSISDSAYRRVEIWGAIHGGTQGAGNASMVSRGPQGDGVNFNSDPNANWCNYGEMIAPATGGMLWYGESDSGNYTLDEFNVANMLNQTNPEQRGVMEILRTQRWGSTGNQGIYKKWFSHPDFGNSGMYLEMSKLVIAVYNFNGGWSPFSNPPPENVFVHYTFQHSVPNKADYKEWTFIGYDEGKDNNVVSIRKGEIFATEILAFGNSISGETRLYEKWSLAIKGISYIFPDTTDPTWTRPATYSSLVDNSKNLESLKDYSQGDNRILYRPTLPSAYSSWKFQGWYDAPNGNLVTQITFEMLGDITLYGIFREAKYEIIYDTYHGHWTNSTPGNPPTLVYEQDISRGTVYYLDDYPAPRRDKLEFAGWYYDTSYSGDRVDRIECDKIRENVMLYAAWIDPETGLFVDHIPWEQPQPVGFFGMIMNFLGEIFGDPYIGLIIIGATLIMLVVLIRLLSGRKKSSGQQSQNATQILTELLIKQQVAAAGVNTIPGQMPGMGGPPPFGGAPGQFPGQFAPTPPPPFAGGFPPASASPFGSMPPPPSFDMGEPPPFVDIPTFDSSAFEDPPPMPPMP